MSLDETASFYKTKLLYIYIYIWLGGEGIISTSASAYPYSTIYSHMCR
jgi:hypothetical protein